MKQIIFTFLCLFSLSGFAEDMMTQSNMEMIVKELADDAKGENGVVEFRYQGMDMYLVSDVNHDRMRIIYPIAEYEKLSKVM